MTPGRLERLHKGACKECGGTDVGGIGFVHHQPTCTRSEFYKRTCSIWLLTILPGEHRAAGVPARHLDCEIDYLEHLDEEHRRG